MALSECDRALVCVCVVRAPEEYYFVRGDQPLCDGGEEKRVTNSNKARYAELYGRAVLTNGAQDEVVSFVEVRGLPSVCPPPPCGL